MSTPHGPSRWLSYRVAGKRLLDILAGLIALAILWPVILVTAIAVRVSMGSPVLFWQERAGRGGRPFRICKFRTMNNRRGPDGQLQSPFERLTRVGAFLRTTSLDEFPQFWLVLTGRMSLVGPRPLHTAYVPYYTDRESLRHTVLPGVTGLAQVSGRDTLTWESRLELDVQYVERLSLGLDAWIVLRTFGKVLGRSDMVDSGASNERLDDYRRRTVTACATESEERR